MKFTELDLKPEILAGLKDMGYEDLTPVQEKTFPDILSGRDMIAKAETGSGKTSAVGVPMVQAIDQEQNVVQGLVLVPTRELAQQYVQEIADIARKTTISSFAVYGGLCPRIQKGKFDHGVHILVATPGRLIDLLYNSPLSLADVRTIVLDEADEMLNMGFIDDVEFIMSCLVHEHQTLLFSATMPGVIKKLAEKHLKDPLTIELNVDQVAPQKLTHCFAATKPHHRFDELVAYLKEEKPKQAILFCNSRTNVTKLNDDLKKVFKSVDCIHGGLDQGKRTSLFNKFKRKETRFMVATDIASRGLDFSHVTHVINFDFPRTLEAYTHRTGRTARMGREGVAVTYVMPRELRNLKELLKINKINPVWIGEEIDLANVGGRRRSSGGRRPGGRGGRPGGQKRSGGRGKPTGEGNSGGNNKRRRPRRKKKPDGGETA